MDDSDRRLAAWADGVVARVAAQDELDNEFLAALGRSPSLREETPAHMAKALWAATPGLGPAGCAAAAGVPQRQLWTWQIQEPAFAAAMASASTLAQSHALATNGTPAPMTPIALRVLLKELRAGARIQPAAALPGVPIDALNRLRRHHPRVNALILAARGRGESTYEHSYRLVRVDNASTGR